MPKVTVGTDVSDYLVPADVPLPARLKGVTERRNEYKYQATHRDVQEGKARVGDTGVVEVWRWEFEVVEGEYKGTVLTGDTPPRLTTHNKTGQWVQALLGRELSKGEDVDTDDLVDLTCLVTVTHKEPRETRRGSLFYPCPVTDVQPNDVF